jgi:hypothetical protein
MTVFQTRIYINGIRYGEYMATILGYPKRHDAHAPSGEQVGSFSGVPGLHPPPASLDAFDRVQQREGKVKQLADGYEQRVKSIIKGINSMATGRAVLASINGSLQYLVIQPWLGGGEPDSPNALHRIGDLDDATVKGKVVRSASTGEVLDPDWFGNGRGSNGVIEYSPDDFAKYLPPDKKTPYFEKQSPGTPNDEGLLHELVHGLQTLWGTNVSKPVRNQKLYDTIEEFYAILITNIYRSECRRDGLRAHHRNFSALNMTDKEFLKKESNRQQLRQFRRLHPTLFAELHDVKAEFNPIRLMWGGLG